MKQNKSFFVIGITGGAGSGKTTVVEQIQQLVPTEFLHCDIIAHELMEPGGASYVALIEEYGTEILDEAAEAPKRISRERLAGIALATEESAKRLNEITHPLVRRKVEERLAELEEQHFSGVAVVEAALLIEAGYQELCDELWYVSAPLSDRVMRMKENRGYTEEKIERLLAAQLSEEEFRKHADFVVENPNLCGEKQKEHLASQILPRLKEKLESRGMVCYNK
ncbi:MAG: dephospho-CoA kinase [Lachnospiraceae bacterium]|nr:dephospho-CoA kinase [Lachnospiraceae bacterium]